MTKDWDNPRPLCHTSPSMREAVAAWNRSLISDAELRLLVDGARAAIEFLEAFGERGMLIGALWQKLRCFEDMQRLRKETA